MSPEKVFLRPIMFIFQSDPFINCDISISAPDVVTDNGGADLRD